MAPCSTHHRIHFKWSGIYLGTKPSSKYVFCFSCFEARYPFFISQTLIGCKLKMTYLISFACDSCNLIKSVQFCFILIGRFWSKADLLPLSSGRKSGILSVIFLCYLRVSFLLLFLFSTLLVSVLYLGFILNNFYYVCNPCTPKKM